MCIANHRATTKNIFKKKNNSYTKKGEKTELCNMLNENHKKQKSGREKIGTKKKAMNQNQ